jgi:hypothetical protein
MTEIINLRMARKRAARDRAERAGSENRLAFGVSKLERKRTSADRESSRRTLEQHKIETGDRQ